jgi:hypothetical protein
MLEMDVASIQGIVTHVGPHPKHPYGTYSGGGHRDAGEEWRELERWDPRAFFKTYNDINDTHMRRLRKHYFTKFLLDLLSMVHGLCHDGCTEGTEERLEWLHNLLSTPYDRFKRYFADPIARHLSIDTPIGRQKFIERFKPISYELDSLRRDWDFPNPDRWSMVEYSAYSSTVDSLLKYLGVIILPDYEYKPWSEDEMQKTNWRDVKFLGTGHMDNGRSDSNGSTFLHSYNDEVQLAWTLKLGLYARAAVQPCKTSERGIQFMWRLCGGRGRFEALVHNTLFGVDQPLPLSTSPFEPMPVVSQLNLVTGLLSDEQPEGGNRLRYPRNVRVNGTDRGEWGYLHSPLWYQTLQHLKEEEEARLEARRKLELNTFSYSDRGYKLPTDLLDIIRQYQ